MRVKLSWHLALLFALASLVAFLGWPRGPELPIPAPEVAAAPVIASSTPAQFVEIIASCDPAFSGTCAIARSGPGTTYSEMAKLRTGMVLRVSHATTTHSGEWYAVTFNEWLRYPARVGGNWYVAASSTRPFTSSEDFLLPDAVATSTKRIVVDRSSQMLYAYDGTQEFMRAPVSTGLALTPTPRGVFQVYRKTPSRYMQGPLPGISNQYYDLPGVPWNLYFTYQGGVIHGAYWHEKFGQPWSHGCVNLSLNDAKVLYEWAELGTEVLVQD